MTKNKTIQNSLTQDKDYLSFINELKNDLKTAQLKAARVVNTHFIAFYWQVGIKILDIQANKPHWGIQLLEQLSQDIRASKRRGTSTSTSTRTRTSTNTGYFSSFF
jgi:hypothetical protein